MPKDLRKHVIPGGQSFAEFMNIDLDVGLTFIDIAKSSPDPDTKARNRRNALKVYDKVQEYLVTKPIPLETVEGIEEKLSRLKKALVDLGETFWA